ncbi:MAG: PilZ domain-containing protein [Spirochaetes bacterium]|nr:PilZ domain-containing protein [Spirochaetota bacterium]
MKKFIVNYHELNDEIKREIDSIVENAKRQGITVDFETAALEWFENFFDEWMENRYGKGTKNLRKHYRMDIEIPVRIVERLIDSDGAEAEEMDFIGKILNISRGGFYFVSKENIHPSSIIKVKIDLSSIDKELTEVEALAMVVRAEKIKENNYGIGVMFSSIYEESKKNLDVFIFKNVAYHLSR